MTRREQLAQELGRLVPLLKQRLQAELPANMGEQLAHATAHQLEAVCQLDRPEGISMNDLARLQNCALSTATALADRLVQQGLAERLDDPGDRRVVRIAPTPQAREMGEHFRETKRQLVLSLVSSLSDDDLATLVRLLGALSIKAELVHG